MSDLINRQDAIDMVCDTLDKMPSAEKTGWWVEKEVSDKGIDEWQSARCSQCGKYHTTPYMYYFDNYKYCPNCGAKMEEQA